MCSSTACLIIADAIKENSWHNMGCLDNLLLYFMMECCGKCNIRKRRGLQNIISAFVLFKEIYFYNNFISDDSNFKSSCRRLCVVFYSLLLICSYRNTQPTTDCVSTIKNEEIHFLESYLKWNYCVDTEHCTYKNRLHIRDDLKLIFLSKSNAFTHSSSVLHPYFTRTLPISIPTKYPIDIIVTAI